MRHQENSVIPTGSIAIGLINRNAEWRDLLLGPLGDQFNCLAVTFPDSVIGEGDELINRKAGNVVTGRQSKC
jgi:hypothetical protein